MSQSRLGVRPLGGPDITQLGWLPIGMILLVVQADAPDILISLDGDMRVLDVGYLEIIGSRKHITDVASVMNYFVPQLLISKIDILSDRTTRVCRIRNGNGAVHDIPDTARTMHGGVTVHVEGDGASLPGCVCEPEHHASACLKASHFNTLRDS